MTPRAISTLVLWQWLTVFLGVVLTGLFLRFYYTDWPNEPEFGLPTYPRLVRNYGFWLCFLPPLWAAISIISVGSLDALPQLRRGYAVAGYVLWAVLILILATAVYEAYEGELGYQAKEQEISRSYQQQHAP